MEGKFDAQAAYGAFVRLMVDENDNYLSVEEAEKRLMNSNMKELFEVHLPELYKQIHDVLVSPMSADSSPLPSEVAQPQPLAG